MKSLTDFSINLRLVKLELWIVVKIKLFENLLDTEFVFVSNYCRHLKIIHGGFFFF